MTDAWRSSPPLSMDLDGSWTGSDVQKDAAVLVQLATRIEWLRGRLVGSDGLINKKVQRRLKMTLKAYDAFKLMSDVNDKMSPFDGKVSP